MSYPERKPIYDAYKAIIKKIINSKSHSMYANGEIDELDHSLLNAFKEIRATMLLNKEWPVED
nr:hypothetical protein [Pedobacter sp. ASV2]